MQKGMDMQYGGIFNRYVDGQLATGEKDWWLQAEGPWHY